MLYVVAVDCHSVLNNGMFVCCFVRDDVNNTFVLTVRAQWRMAMVNREVRLGITKCAVENGNGEP